MKIMIQNKEKKKIQKQMTIKIDKIGTITDSRDQALTNNGIQTV